ncbi:MAG: blue (type 1) copper domain protein [Solirubrobacteraceae bacterium]|nr:blue (type 1) copper domain protein [Solirubrobacteraceae bacterium]
MRSLSLTVLVCALLLAVTGCGSSSSSSSSSGSGGSGASSTPAAPAASGGATAIPIKNFAFNPSSETVKVGQKVTWTNKDAVAHNVVAQGTFSSKTLNQGDSFSYTPTKAGTISYVCTFHSNMKATLTVTG